MVLGSVLFVSTWLAEVAPLSPLLLPCLLSSCGVDNEALLWRFQQTHSLPSVVLATNTTPDTPTQTLGAEKKENSTQLNNKHSRFSLCRLPVKFPGRLRLSNCFMHFWVFHANSRPAPPPIYPPTHPSACLPTPPHPNIIILLLFLSNISSSWVIPTSIGTRMPFFANFCRW